MKIRLAGIAKNESPYIAEWIFHHLYFGFDEICIYVNRTNDNTINILKKIRKNHKNVFYKHVDYLDMIPIDNIQIGAYALGLEEARNNDCDYLMYLDIDEFWTPSDFQTKISQHLSQLNTPDVVSYEWLNKINEQNKFGRPFEKSITGFIDFHVKSIFRTNLKVERVFAHNIYALDAKYVLADGSPLFNDSKHKAKLPNCSKNLKEAFVVHRMYRSELEYVASLNRGRPQVKSNFKNNRPGFNVTGSSPIVSHDFDRKIISQYNNDYDNFIVQSDISEDIKVAQDRIRTLIGVIIRKIKNSTIVDLDDILKIFYGVKLKPIIPSLTLYLQSMEEESVNEDIKNKIQVMIKSLQS